MKKIILILALVHFSLFTLHCLSQPAIQWAKCYGDTSENIANNIIVSNDGNYVIASYAWTNDDDIFDYHGNGQRQAWIVKIDLNGAIIWSHCYGGNGGDEAMRIIQTSDGGYIFAATSSSNDGDISGNNHGDGDVWIVKINDTGTIQWSKCYGGSFSETPYSIIQTTDGGYLFASQTQSHDGDVIGHHGQMDYWIVKINDTGAIQWTQCYGGSLVEFPGSMIQTLDGGYIVAGEANSTNGDVNDNLGGADYWVIKLDTAGSIQWKKSYGGTGNDQATAIIRTDDGGYIVSGTSSSSDIDVTGGHGGGDYWIAKLNDTGAIQWEKCYGGSNVDAATSFVKTIDGKYAIGGYTYSNDGEVTSFRGVQDYWVIKIDTNGLLLWEKTMGSIDEDWALSMAPTPDNGLIIAGMTDGNDGDVSGRHGVNYNFDCWIVKLSPDSMVGIENVASSENPIIVYPNPACNELSVSIHQENSNEATVILYNATGKTVYTKNYNNLSSTFGSTFSISRLPAGVYSLEVIIDGKKFIKQVVKE